jgi:hypothetical protein
VYLLDRFLEAIVAEDRSMSAVGAAGRDWALRFLKAEAQSARGIDVIALASAR